MLLKYKCTFCCGDLEYLLFYNPCSFLLHTRQHYTLLGGQLNLDQLELSILPYGLGGFLPDPNVPLIYHVEADNVGEASFINSRFYSPIPENIGQKIVNFQPNELLFFSSSEPNAPSTSLVLKQLSLNIPRCQFVVLDNNRFTPIPNGLDINGRELFSTNPEAHNNSTILHNVEMIKEEPPEESEEFNMPVITKIETLSTERSTLAPPHQKKDAENFSCCPECGEVQMISMSKHFLDTAAPFQDHLKCANCKYIAPTQCSLQAHQRIHVKAPPYVCPECGKDFHEYEWLQSHLEEVCFHLAKQVRLRCPGKRCRRVFAQIVTFTAHFSSHLVGLMKCVTCGETFTDSKDFMHHNEMHDPQEQPSRFFKCTVCEDSEDNYVIATMATMHEHIHEHCTNKKQCLYVYTCKRCRSYFRSTLTYATHLLRCTKPLPHQTGSNAQFRINKEINNEENTRKRGSIQIYGTCWKCKIPVKLQPEHHSLSTLLCDYCKYREKNAQPINRNDTKIMDNGKCLLCQEKLSLNDMTDHFGLKRCKYQNPIVRIDRCLITPSSEPNSPAKSDESPKKKRKKVKLRKPLIISNTTTDYVNAEEPTPFDGTYRCKLCDFANETRQKFHEHVLEHRDVCTAYQCMECGECFVVKPSLVKHLLYYHQITDIENYFNENDCFDKKAVEDLENYMRLAPGESKEPVAENQCRVCLEPFNDNLELSKHFRIHGMAFLLKNTK